MSRNIHIPTPNIGGVPIEICPTCGNIFDSIKSRNIHHQRKHGLSLALKKVNCVYCGEHVESYAANQRACSDCRGEAISDGKDEGLIEECEFCGNDVNVQRWERSQKQMFFCDLSCKGSWQEERKARNHPSWRGGYNGDYGNNWAKQRERALDRDGRECRICGDGVEEIGRSPDVHHIVPFRTFDDYEKANQIDNLICLCPVHHQKVECGNIQTPTPKQQRVGTIQ